MTTILLIYNTFWHSKAPRKQIALKSSQVQLECYCCPWQHRALWNQINPMTRNKKGHSGENLESRNQSRAEVLQEGRFTLWSKLVDITGWKRDINEVSLQLLMKLIIRKRMQMCRSVETVFLTYKSIITPGCSYMSHLIEGETACYHSIL